MDLVKYTKQWVMRRDTYGEYTPLPKRKYDRLCDWVLRDHFNNKRIIGLYISDTKGYSNQCIIDIDAHDSPNQRNFNLAIEICKKCMSIGLLPIQEDSNGQGGYKIRIWFHQRKPIDQLNSLGCWLTRNPKIEVFPKQRIPTELGHFVRLPGKHHKRQHISKIYNFASHQWEELDYLVTFGANSYDRVPGEALTYTHPGSAKNVARKSFRTSVSHLIDLPLSPWERYNQEADWCELLEGYGWTLTSVGHDGIHNWCRPGKSGEISACTHYPRSQRMWVFTTSTCLPETLTARDMLSKFAVYIHYSHNGCLSSAIHSLRSIYVRSR